MNIKYLSSALAIASALCLGAGAAAQNKPLDHDVYDSWQSVGNVKMSDDGRVIVWTVNPQEGDGTLYVRVQSQKGRGRKAASQLEIPRGYQPDLDAEGHWLYCRIKPQFAKNRKERIAKKKKEDMTKDTLAVVDLLTMTVRKLGTVESFTTGFKGKPYIAYKSSWKEMPKPKDGAEGAKAVPGGKPEPPKGVEPPKPGEAPKDTMKKKPAPPKKPQPVTKSGLIIYSPETERADTILDADAFTVSNYGDLIAYTTKKDKKDSTRQARVILGRFVDGLPWLDTLAKGAESYGKPSFSDDGALIGFTATTDTNKTGSKRHSLYLGRLFPDRNTEVKEIVPQGTKVAGTDGWTLTEHSSIWFTPDSKRLVTGIAPLRPPKDTGIVDFETAQVDIWSWDAPFTPPQQKLRLSRTLSKTYTAIINLDEPTTRIVPLSTSFFDGVSLINGGKGDLAISRDNSNYVRESAWSDERLVDVSLVNLRDGSRKKVADKMNVGRLEPSPGGKYILYFNYEDLNWYTYEIATGAVANLTAQCGVPFYDELDDHPSKSKTPHDQMPQWLEGDQAVLIIDRYDIWKFAPDGSSAVNLTGGVGRSTHNRFRTSDPVWDTRTENERRAGLGRSLAADGNVTFSVLNEDDKRNGFGTLNLARPVKTLKYFTDTVSFNFVTKSPASDRILFTKGNFRNCYDLYATDNYFTSAQKLTAINPQKADYRWGKAELFSWKAYDGTPLQGLVFIPDGVKATDKLPVMIYFYEKNADQLYMFRTPAPSRSVVNISFFTSRGYLVFIPDIVYVDGHPGESAYNCICSGAEALCEKYPFADKSRMGIQGQSWGGYQTAWLVTRTDMFAAAGAGAPVSNMTSAYGGIRWESGITRAGQYEHGQSRIGKTLWDEGGLDLYIENSPVFHADKVNTPLLIMHNDEDGAVPWYQGIEYFSDLRRLGKPCWLLEYNKEAHNLRERRNCKDLSKRLSQFFDHYLKGEPMPAWMKTGVPTDRKGEYFGFEEAK